MSADGNIKFLDSGKTQLKYTAKIKKEKLRSLTFDLTGYSLYSADNVDNVEDIIISYPGKKKKKLKL